MRRTSRSARASTPSRARPGRARRSSRRRSGSSSARAPTRRSSAPRARRRTEAELDVPEGFFDDEEAATLAELRPEGEPGLVLARRGVRGRAHPRLRVGALGRARGRRRRCGAAPRDVGPVRAASPSAPRVPARRPGRVLRARAARAPSRRGGGMARAARGAPGVRGAHARRGRRGGATRGAGGARRGRGGARGGGGGRPAGTTGAATARGRARRSGSRGGQAIAPDDGEGAAGLAARAEHELAPPRADRTEVGTAAAELRELTVRLREVGSDLHGFLASLEADPGALEDVEAGSGASPTSSAASARRPTRSCSRGPKGRAESSRRRLGRDPGTGGSRRAARRRGLERRTRGGATGGCRRSQSRPFAEAVAAELHGLGLGEGRVRRRARRAGSRPYRGARGRIHGPASGVSRSRRSQRPPRAESSPASPSRSRRSPEARRSSSTRSTPASAGYRARVASTLQRLAGRAQVLTITHLPQIASVADRHFRVERSGRPHAHPARGAGRGAPSRRARADGGRRRFIASLTEEIPSPSRRTLCSGRGDIAQAIRRRGVAARAQRRACPNLVARWPQDRRRARSDGGVAAVGRGLRGGRIKFRVGRIVYLAFSRDGR